MEWQGELGGRVTNVMSGGEVGEEGYRCAVGREVGRG